MAAEDDVGSTIPLWSLTEDTLVEVGGDASIVVVTRWGEFAVDGVDALAAESLRRMALGPVSLGNVLPPGEDPSGFAGFRRVLARLRGSVVRSLGLPDAKGPLLSMVPIGQAPDLLPRPVPGDRPLRLSRFATLRTDGGRLLMESPRSSFRAVLARSEAMRVASALATPASVDTLAEWTELPGPLVADLVSYLVAANMVLVGTADGGFAEDTDQDLVTWTHHELLFGVRSRAGLGDGSAERAPDTPAVPAAEVSSQRTLLLYRPDLDADRAGGVALTALLEADHTWPSLSDRTVTVDQLGELLYRSARVRSAGPVRLPDGRAYEASQRPYFTIGCLYELEIYLSAGRCAGLSRGIYRYDPYAHALAVVNDDQDDVSTLLDLGRVAASVERYPAALLTVTARHGRGAWLFGGATHATALQHLGALQQVLHLTASAMGLAAHAVVVEDASDRVDRLLRLRWPDETAVGECVLDVLP